MTHYSTLNVKSDATPEEIKASYRRLAMKYHPDKNNGNKESEEKFKALQEAYSTLSDPNKRRAYDYSLNAQKSSFNNHHEYSSHNFRNSDFDENFDFYEQFHSSPFEDIFKNFNQTRRQQSTKTNQKSQDIKKTISVSLKFWEAVFGCVKRIKIPARILPGNLQANIQIPEGISDGDQLLVTIKNQSFYISINVKEDKNFTRKNLDIYTKFDVPLTTAMLGGSIIFPHWSKEVEITIPPEISDGQVMRLKNMGIKRKDLIGDMYIIVNITTPKRLTKRQKELMEEFKKLEKTKESTSYKNLQKLWESVKN
jgi:curved DNA-binding protein